MDIKELLAAAVVRAALAAMDEGILPKAELPEVLLETPPEKSFGHQLCHASSAVT